MRNYAELDRGWATPPTNARRKTAVITDDGVKIDLVLLDAGEPATTGSRFSYRGQTWEICGSRQGSKVLVAEPAERPRQ